MPEEEREQGEESKVKWAAEAYAFLSLFSLLRNKLSGLLMLEFGWGPLVRVVAPLSECPSEDFLSPLNHLDSMEPILIRGRGFHCGRIRTGRGMTAIT